MCATACQTSALDVSANASRQEARPEQEVADSGVTPLPTEPSAPRQAQPPALSYELAILHVLIPREAASEAEKIWNYLREDALDARTQIRLRENGLRIGIGHAQWWEPIKAVLDAIEGQKVTFATPVRLPAGYPLLLELDVEMQEQTLFYVGSDGILTGATWPESRNVLRVAYAPDPQGADRVLLFAVPEVHRQTEGWEWIRAEAGLRADPKERMETFDVVGVRASLASGEFLLLAPNENARIAGLLGGAFFTKVSQGQCYHSYVFLRPVANHVGRHD